MSKPYEIPQDVWDEACAAGGDFVERCARASSIIKDRVEAVRNRPAKPE